MSVATAQAEQDLNRKFKMMICDDSNIIRRKIERELKLDGEKLWIGIA